jgi:hypothetical protein
LARVFPHAVLLAGGFRTLHAGDGAFIVELTAIFGGSAVLA